MHTSNRLLLCSLIFLFIFLSYTVNPYTDLFLLWSIHLGRCIVWFEPSKLGQVGLNCTVFLPWYSSFISEVIEFATISNHFFERKLFRFKRELFEFRRITSNSVLWIRRISKVATSCCWYVVLELFIQRGYKYQGKLFTFWILFDYIQHVTRVKRSVLELDLVAMKPFVPN